MVLNILKQRQPLSTKDIFAEAIQLKPNAPIPPFPLQQVPKPPHPEHPVRSIRFLKQVILPSLESTKQVEKFHTIQTLSPEQQEASASQNTKQKPKRKSPTPSQKPQANTVHAWLWRLREQKEIALPVQQEKDPMIDAVGLYNNIDHLNKRRRRSRDKSHLKDMNWATRLEEARLQRAADS